MWKFYTIQTLLFAVKIRERETLEEKGEFVRFSENNICNIAQFSIMLHCDLRRFHWKMPKI